MAGRSRLPEVEEIRRLHFEDGLTTRQIADKYGLVSTTAVTRLIKYGYRIIPVGIITDPKDVLKKELYAAIDPKNIAAWRKDWVCMCGCGEKVSLRPIDSRFGKMGEPSFFRTGHDNRVYHRRHNGWQHNETSRARMRVALLRYSIHAGILADIVKEWRTERGMTQRQAARKFGVDKSVIAGIEGGSLPRIKKRTAIKIYEGMGMTPPDNLYDVDPPRVQEHYSIEKAYSPTAREPHFTLFDGKAFQDIWGNVIWGRSTNEPGVGRCSCGVKTPVMERDRDRVAWLREHKAKMMEMAS